ncbi:TonB-dependent receptor [Porticoccaceae bacterium LTM1]|nr:TonB-dependent receptor [Porticoccaceae bacterium LTM1]
MKFSTKKKLVLGMAPAIALLVSGGLYAEDMDKFKLEISSQSADAALLELGRQTGSEIMFKQGLDVQMTLPELKGEHTLEAALNTLLRGTGLTYSFTADGLVVLEQVKQEASESKEVEEVVVTGSRLKNVTTASQVQIITREDIKQQGLGSVEDIVRILTQNVSNVNAATTNDNSITATGAQGQSAINLRGLGTSATLVLVNGRRWPQSSFYGNGTVNLNGIPFSAIDRVEVLLDGASAIYGADAQAGVINFIMRKDYVGGETTARYEGSRNNGNMFSLEQNFGVNWNSGRALLTVNYKESKPVNSVKAGLTTSDFTSLGGSDNRATYYAQPGIVNSADYTLIGSLPEGDDGSDGVAGKLSPDNVVPFDQAKILGNQATSLFESTTAFLTVSQEVLDSVELYGELSYSANESTSSFGAPYLYYTPVPTTNPYNDTGEEVLVTTIFATELLAGLFGDTRASSDQDSLSYTLGVKAALPFRDWELDFSLSRSEEDFYFAVPRMNDALMAQRLAGIDEDGNPLPIEQIVNPFGDGSAQHPEAFEGLMTVPTDGSWAPSTTGSEMDSYLLSVEGGVFDLPAGEVRLVMGTEHRTEILDFTQANTLGLSVFAPEREVESYFAELGVPLFDGVPGIYSLDLNVALRRDTYSFEGPFNGPDMPFSSKEFTHTAPKLELAWKPIESLKVRASQGESFRTPTLRSLFSERRAPYIGWDPIVDPSRPDLGAQTPLWTTGGNPNLKPETSDSLSYGFDWAPTGVLEGLFVSVTRTEIDIEGMLTRWTEVFYDAPELLFEIPGVVDYNADGSIRQLNFSSFNLASRTSESTDINVTYDFDTDVGSFRAGLNATYYSVFKDQLSEKHTPKYGDGKDNGPDRIRVRGLLSWFKDDLSLNFIANYSSSYEHSGAGIYSPQKKIKSHMTYDLTASYLMEDSGWKFNGGIRDVFNADFPFYDGFGRPWDPRRVDTRGRLMYLEVSKSYNLY